MIEFLLCLVYIAAFIWLIHHLKFFDCQGLGKNTIAGIFILKVLAGLVLSLIYTYYYTDRSTADIFKYFDDSKVMFGALSSHPRDYLKMLLGIANDNDYFTQNYYSKMDHWFRKYESNIYNDSHTVIRFNALIHLFSFGYYHVHTVFMCFISLTGLTGIYKAFQSKPDIPSGILAFAVFLIPSIVLWSSGVLKEGLLFFGLGMIVYHYFRFVNGNHSVTGIVITLFSIGLLIILKFYILIALLPGMIAYFWVRKKGQHALLKYIVVGLFLALLAINFHHFKADYDLLQILTRKQADFIGLVQENQSGSRFAVTPLEPTIASFVKNIPEAIGNTLFRPFPWKINNFFAGIAGIENTAILLFGIFCIIFSKSFKKIDKNLMLFLLSYTFILYVLIGWITPVSGAIVRYRIPAIPFLLTLFLIIADFKRISKMAGKIKAFRLS